MTPEQALNRLDETFIGDLELKIALSKALEKLITMDLIDRQALLRKLFPYEVVDKKNCVINAYAVEKAILDMPSAGCEETTGKWLMGEDLAGYEYGVCSICGYVEYDAFPTGRTPKYCSNCGTRMEV